jgi:hypothetical protein
MAGSVTPEYGILIKVFIALLVFTGIAYLSVIIKLSVYDSHSITWRILFGAITPGVIIVSLIIASLIADKTINVISLVLLCAINMIYLLTPVNAYLSTLVYKGNNKILLPVLMGVISISTFILIFSALVSILYWTIKILKL